MKKIVLTLAFAAMCMLTQPAIAQECNYTVDDKTEGQELKSLPEYLMYEKVFAGTSQFLFFSLSISRGMPLVNMELLSKSKDFAKAYCIDKASKIYIQLANGKIISLISATEEQCSGLMYDANEKNNIRILTGVFLFPVGSIEELEKSPISFIRVKYTTESVDYSIKRELNSETMKKAYNPERYFMDYLKCIK
ncbi:hypothetical protein ACLI09_06625 [Flavobacterium sp. RHBU_24]|uniref:hypothetical protein n=1 Tax=Flavobacterium sp. RHBU_24 TaxID=3391185 RepID=UPI0039853807